MHYLYTLTSSIKDTYYEQFLMSAASLKLKMPGADIILLCDSKTKETLTGKRSEYEKLVSKTIAAEVPDITSQVEVSRWLKTSMRRFVQGDFLFIDCDTIIADDLSSIENMGIDFGACLDKHCVISNHEKGEYIIGNDKKLGFSSYLSNKHFNSGVIFCTDTSDTKKIFNRWHELWLFSKSKNIVRDQPSLNMAIHENGSFITELNGTWNCQITHNGLPYLSNSKIIHYFASDRIFHTLPFVFTSNEIFAEIKNTGVIPDEVLEMLKTPKSAFLPESRIITGKNMLHLINSDIFESAVILQKRLPRFFNFINRLCSIVKKITKSIMVKKAKNKNGETKFYN